jgi:hypothetical protein
MHKVGSRPQTAVTDRSQHTMGLVYRKYAGRGIADRRRQRSQHNVDNEN